MKFNELREEAFSLKTCFILRDYFVFVLNSLMLDILRKQGMVFKRVLWDKGGYGKPHPFQLIHTHFQASTELLYYKNLKRL